MKTQSTENTKNMEKAVKMDKIKYTETMEKDKIQFIENMKIMEKMKNLKEIEIEQKIKDI